MKLVTQEHPLGCAVACVASRCGLTYEQARRLFAKPEHAWQRGYYCPEVVEALAKAGHACEYAEFEPRRHARQLRRIGTIVFVAPNDLYPQGHYLLRTARGWMNPWANFPRMVPVKARIEPRLPGRVTHLVFST